MQFFPGIPSGLPFFIAYRLKAARCFPPESGRFCYPAGLSLIRAKILEFPSILTPNRGKSGDQFKVQYRKVHFSALFFALKKCAAPLDFSAAFPRDPLFRYRKEKNSENCHKGQEIEYKSLI